MKLFQFHETIIIKNNRKRTRNQRKTNNIREHVYQKLNDISTITKENEQNQMIFHINQVRGNIEKFTIHIRRDTII